MFEGMPVKRCARDSVAMVRVATADRALKGRQVIVLKTKRGRRSSVGNNEKSERVRGCRKKKRLAG